MQKLYLNYPEITDIKANIVSRRSNGDNTQVILDRTIFMPSSDHFIKDRGNISGLEILSIEEKRDNIIHTVKGKFQKSAVILHLDKANRMRNLTYNTAFIIFKLVFQSFYLAKDIKLLLLDDKFIVRINDFYDVLDENLMEDQINFLISKAVQIENNSGITSIYPFGEIINNDICYDNTSKVRGFKIITCQNIGNDLDIEFIAGDDLIHD
ncbi:alanyl-tRNA editing protein [Anaerococcus provencensis]|uniref:hypothetical protein n=1 Tax=Anaerococcus provencensis TaxID=938293 RepID=UPI0003184CD0|nr:hypothetical protein [Anaerococcus provencensis]